ncbi:RNA polymerase sigma-70 factor [Ktedonospora formicarum]|uniref:DNA-directed RNA polymerase sigma-70 factor n=1 Tax=Ktedonospora formicarum TaxID=2778364 RepID=A0A8J3HZE7_9CHLR|nr:RNA polymerase sigma-70 factor [Ktedonospora formicarum]GHO43462.1 DNA-directed RNA polymerase sigma-70 factor [Ktedonospora formicarum]
MTRQESLQAEEFQHYRPLLFAVAYRMLGSASEAEDMLQEGYLRYRQAASGEIRSLKSYLTTIITRLCLDHLKSARVQREDYIGPWLPEPLITVDAEDLALQTLEQRETLSTAFLMLAERLTPYERAVFLLHEAFTYRYEEISEIVGKSPANCRQLLHQAKEHLARNRVRFSPAREEQQRLMERFLSASQEGDMQALVQVLAQDVTLWPDGGGKVYAAPYPVPGRERVLRLWNGLMRQSASAYPNAKYTLTQVNEGIGLMIWSPETLLSVFTCEIENGQITALYEVVNPDKLTYIQRQARPTE